MVIIGAVVGGAVGGTVHKNNNDSAGGGGGNAGAGQTLPSGSTIPHITITGTDSTGTATAAITGPGAAAPTSDSQPGFQSAATVLHDHLTLLKNVSVNAKIQCQTCLIRRFQPFPTLAGQFS